MFSLPPNPANSGWDKLWKTFKRELCTKTISEYLSSGEIKGHLEKLGLKYEEHMIPNTFDVTNCFTQGSKQGELLLDFMTDTDNFQQNFSEEVKAGMLDLIKNKCSIQKDGRVLFDCTLSCLLVFAWTTCSVSWEGDWVVVTDTPSPIILNCGNAGP